METNDLLIEIGTEELPPRSLLRMINAFADNMAENLAAEHLKFAVVDRYATPRRLTLIVRDLAAMQPEIKNERRGPALTAAFDKSGEPTRAALGFAGSCGVDVKQLERLKTDKGEWLLFRENKPGKPVQALIADIITQSLARLPIERAMRWGSSRTEFIRPVHWAVILYGNDIIEAQVLSCTSGRSSKGHRFMSGGCIDIDNSTSYLKQLEAANVIADHQRRRNIIESQLTKLAADKQAKVVIDPALLDEVTALVEWPVTLYGQFDPDYLQVPSEVLISAMKTHQRYFHLEDDKGQLLPGFLFVSNIESRDPATVVKGNERVVTPRLADASFFFSQDQKTTLEQRLDQLRKVVFQAELGSYFDKAERVAKTAGFLAEQVGASSQLAARAGLLAKCDLVTDMVSEFPDLQGLMGGYYSALDGEAQEVATAITEHYLPLQSGGELPASTTGQCVAVADKLDTLTGLFGIGQPPTGSRDPFALRRQALGIIRICIERGLSLDVRACLDYSADCHKGNFDADPVLDYLLERLGVSYQDNGIPTDTVRAIRQSDAFTTILTDLDERIRALEAFRTHPQSGNLIAANKRVFNILKGIHESELPDVRIDLFELDIEQQVYDAMAAAQAQLAQTTSYADRFSPLAELQPVIDDYFEQVMVMCEDKDVRQNRLANLVMMKKLFLTVANFSELQT